MKALVTGGAGFIGSNLVAALVARGDEALVVDDLSTGDPRNLEGLAAKLVEGDVRDARQMRDLVSGADAVFHLAASVGNTRSIEDPVRDATTNVLGTVNVLEAARRGGVRTVVVSSSAAIFGEMRTLPIREDHPCEPDSPYGCTKLCAEKLALSYARLHGIRVVCLRYFNVYGPNQRFDAYGNVIPIFVFRMLRDQPLTVYGDGEQTRDFVNVRDVVQANLRAALAPAAVGAFNVACGQRTSVNEVVRLLSEISGRTPEIVHAPPRQGDVRDSVADVSAARGAFDYRPSVGMREGLEAYWRWAAAEAAGEGVVA